MVRYWAAPGRKQTFATLNKQSRVLQQRVVSSRLTLRTITAIVFTTCSGFA